VPANPLVSIVTPSYNQAKYLEKTITSVIEQDYPSLEYLVVDGNSSDGSQAIIKKFEHHIDWWVSEADKGQAEAINKGLSRAKGKIVAWLNSDDYYLPGAIKKAVATFNENPQVAFIYGDVLALNAAGAAINHMRYRPMALADLMMFNIIGQSSVFINRSLLEQVGFLDITYQFLLDHQLWLRLAQKGPVHYLPELLSAAHFHPQSKNVAKAGEFGLEAYHIVEWMCANPSMNEIYEQNRAKILAGAHRINARYLLDGGQPWPAFIAYMKCMRTHFSTAMTEWPRILFSLAASAGLGKLKYLHPRWRKRERE
jgi:GT2 family glycosyltransferase